jgi:hypothetical protein
VRTHLIDLIQPEVLAWFMATPTARLPIIAGEHVPIVVRGTGLYLRAL